MKHLVAFVLSVAAAVAMIWILQVDLEAIGIVRFLVGWVVTCALIEGAAAVRNME